MHNEMNKELFDERENYLMQPLKDVLPGDIRAWLCDNDNESSLARVLAHVHNKTMWLMDDLDDADEAELPEIRVIFDEWCGLHSELYEKALSILKEENRTRKASHNLEVNGQYFKLAPFMYRNGYKSDTNGGWKKLALNERVGEETALQHMMDSRVFFVSDDDDPTRGRFVSAENMRP
jgi:hypothetical protein